MGEKLSGVQIRRVYYKEGLIKKIDRRMRPALVIITDFETSDQ